MIAIVPASVVHIGPLANRMRDIDALECAVAGRTPKQALRLSLASSALAWTAKVDGRVEAMMGVCSVSTIEGIGSPWMLMTDEAVRHPRALVGTARVYLAQMLARFPTLENRVHAHNDVAIRWLMRLGFEIGPIDVINGQPMRGFRQCAIRSLLR